MTAAAAATTSRTKKEERRKKKNRHKEINKKKKTEKKKKKDKMKEERRRRKIKKQALYHGLAANGGADVHFVQELFHKHVSPRHVHTEVQNAMLQRKREKRERERERERERIKNPHCKCLGRFRGPAYHANNGSVVEQKSDGILVFKHDGEVEWGFAKLDGNT